MEDTTREFHETMGLPIAEGVSIENTHHRVKLISEEYLEFIDAAAEMSLNLNHPRHKEYRAHALKELTDILYVVLGTFTQFGWDAEEALARVHASNMSKEPFKGVDGSTFKIRKGENYQAPELGDLV